MLYLVLELKMIIKIFDLVHVVDLGPCMEKMNVHQAKTHFSAILEKAHNGEVVIIAKAGKPYARLMPLDTHCLLWWWSADSELSDAVRSLSENPVNTIIVSAASAWEISAKTRISHIL
jgi:prevent-host-death family protein